MKDEPVIIIDSESLNIKSSEIEETSYEEPSQTVIEIRSNLSIEPERIQQAPSMSKLLESKASEQQRISIMQDSNANLSRT